MVTRIIPLGSVGFAAGAVRGRAGTEKLGLVRAIAGAENGPKSEASGGGGPEGEVSGALEDGFLKPAGAGSLGGPSGEASDSGGPSGGAFGESGASWWCLSGLAGGALS